ncbi:Chaperone protein IpgC [Thalassocella blandensis]|nr:Chaperone protein IpgC [Thalassocella blandensis]
MISELKPGIDLRLLEPQDWEYFLENGGTLGDALEMKEQELEAIYTLAYEKYANGNFIEAKPLFQLLCYCNHIEAKYILGLGATRQALEQYELAGETYSFAAFVHGDDPRFPFHAAECHLALDNWESAKSGFEVCIYRCENFKHYAWYMEQAQKNLEILHSRLNESDA